VYPITAVSGDVFWMSDVFWGAVGVIFTQIVILVTVLVNRRGTTRTHEQLDRVERHVNNVEEDIDHDDQDISLGQRLKRIETDMRSRFDLNDEAHEVIMVEAGKVGISAFRQASWFDPVAAYQIAAADGTPPWRIEWINPAWSKLTGLDLSEARSHQYVAAMHPEDRQRVLDAVTYSLDHGEPVELRYRILTPDGTGWRWVELYGEPYRTLTGQPLGQIGVVRESGEVGS
jgi:PAS domain S-box-containing protein